VKNILLILLFFWALAANAQVVINEASNDNEAVIQDEFGNYPDWIELYNIGTNAVNLEGYYLSDNETKPNKWAFPDVTIAPDEHLLIFASGLGIGLHTSFKLSKTGEPVVLFSPVLEQLDLLEMRGLDTDISAGRTSDGGNTKGFFKYPTPGTTNNNSVQISRVAIPIFQNDIHFYESSTEVNITCGAADCTIRYTLDGSEPTEQSNLYNNAITIDTTTSIRAKAFQAGALASEIATSTYFINEQHTLPIIAINADPFDLYDSETGILQLGPNADTVYPYWGANYWEEITLPISMEYFDENQERKVQFNLGTEMHGGRGSRVNPQKAFRLLGGYEFGDPVIDYPFFEDRAIDSYKYLVLRNSSGDYNHSHFRDGFAHETVIADTSLNVDCLAYKPVVMYLNGAYYGVINLREKVSEYYLAENHGVNPFAIDFLEEDSLIIAGDRDRWNEDTFFVRNNDLSIQANFDYAATLFDVESMADYFIVQTGLNNPDWPQNNIKYWRPQTVDGKWRYILFDLDSAMNRWGWTTAFRDMFGLKMRKVGPGKIYLDMLKAFLENEEFYHYFCNRYADLFNTTFREEVFLNDVLTARDRIEPEMLRHFEKWTDTSYESWFVRRVIRLIDFANDRPSEARRFVMEYFELPNEVLLELKTYPEGAGTIKINTIQPDLPWDGYYFNGIPVSLEIVPNPGYTFSHWGSIHAFDKNTDIAIQYNFGQNDAVTAFFTSSYEGLNASLSPNPTTDIATLTFTLDHLTNVTLDLYTSNGQWLKNLENRVYNGGNHQVNLNFDGLIKGVHLLKITTDTESTTLKVLVN